MATERKTRPKAISEQAKRLIIHYSLLDINQPREIVANILRKEIRITGERPPTVETLKREISAARNRPESPLDTSWQLGLAEKYNLSSEQIAAIIEVIYWAEKFKERPTIRVRSEGWVETMTNGKIKDISIWPLTLREALWISRLYSVKYNLSPPERLYFERESKKQPIPERRMLIENPSKLWETAKSYADYERLCELAGTPFNTSRLDEALIKDIGTGRAIYDLFKNYREGESDERPHNTTEQE